MADDSKLVFEDDDRLRRAIDDYVEAEEYARNPATGAEFEIWSSVEFGSLVEAVKELKFTTAALLLSPDASAERKQQVRKEFVDLMIEANAEIRRRFADLKCNRDRTQRMH